MMQLDYKGLKSTRVVLGVIASLAVTAGWLWGDVTAAQWIGFLEWSLAGYTASEVGIKGAIALKGRLDA